MSKAPPTTGSSMPANHSMGISRGVTGCQQPLTYDRKVRKCWLKQGTRTKGR